MEKKGFTLIELLAVIVILAIIALIATPIILNIINDVKEKSRERSVENIIKASELYYGSSNFKNENKNEIEIYDEVIKNVDGEKPSNGQIFINKDGQISFSLEYDGVSYVKLYDSSNYTKEEISYLADVSNQKNSTTELFFNGPLKKEQIEKIITVLSSEVPEKLKANSWDVSAQKNGKIMAWYDDSDGNGLYEVYIGQDGGVKANPNSKFAFKYLNNLKEADFTYLNTGLVTTMQGMFYYCSNLIEIKSINNFNVSNVTDMMGMFLKCNSLRELDLNQWNTSKVRDMSYLFGECKSLMLLDVSNFNTSKVTTMRSMFCECNNLQNLDVSSFVTSNVESFGWMFYGCSKLTTLDVSNFDTKKAKQLELMFYGCTKLKELDLSSFNTSNVEDISSLVAVCSNLEKINVSNWNTSKIEDMGQVFFGCTKLTSLDLRSWNTSSATKMIYMFYNTSNLKSIYVGENWIINEDTPVTDMFSGSATKNVDQLCKPDSTYEWCVVTG